MISIVAFIVCLFVLGVCWLLYEFALKPFVAMTCCSAFDAFLGDFLPDPPWDALTGPDVSQQITMAICGFAIVLLIVICIFARVAKRSPWLCKLMIRALVTERGEGASPDFVLLWLARHADMKRVARRETIAQRARGIQPKPRVKSRKVRVAANDNREGMPAWFTPVKRAA